MKKIKLIAVGKLKEKFFSDACDEYLKRLSRFADVSVCELKDRADNKAGESDEILSAIKGYVILSDIEGTQLNSLDFSMFISDAMENNDYLSIVIGGSCGVDERVKARADKRISFGKMTFPHMLMRVIMLEQLYRAFTIKEGMPYHK